MPIINNSASATYNYGEDQSSSATSNVATANLLDTYSITGEKGVLSGTFRPGENETYYIQVTNSGTSSLYDVTVSDDLGGATNPLTYVTGTGYFVINEVFTALTPTSLNPLVFTLPEPLTSGQTATILYVARVSDSVGIDETEIVNSASISARGGSPTGEVISVTPSPTASIVREDYANISIVKSVSSDTVSAGVPFSYTLTLENDGNLPATDIVVTDVLPEGFVINSITSTTNGVTTTYDASTYSVDAQNTLTLPTSGPQISVPASESGVPGVTTITITGQFNA